MDTIRESGNKLVLDSNFKSFQEVLESKERKRKEMSQRKETKKVSSVDSWERANRHLENTRQQKHVLLNRGWL